MNPGPRRPVGSLKASDFVVALQRQRNLVETLQETFPPARINLEIVPLSRRRSDRLRLKIDADPPCPLRCATSCSSWAWSNCFRLSVQEAGVPSFTTMRVA